LLRIARSFPSTRARVCSHEALSSASIRPALSAPKFSARLASPVASPGRVRGTAEALQGLLGLTALLRLRVLLEQLRVERLGEDRLAELLVRQRHAVER